MNILVHGTILGYGGIAHHTREFTKALSKYHNVKIRNFNLVDLDDWTGYTGPHILKNAKHLEDVHHKLLYQQTLYNDNGELTGFPLSGYEESFVPDIHIVMSEVNHYYHYQEYSGPVIFYFLWETTHIIPVFLEKLREIDYIWVPSEWQMEVLICSGINPDKISVVNLSLDPDKFFPIEKKNDKLTFLHIGTWGYRKSSYEIIKTFSDIFGNNDEVELRISINNKLDYQDGPIETFEKFGLPLNRNIKILDTLSEDDYVKEIQNSDLYISCSRGEGWNLPLIQSMACGVPSIYSRTGGQLEFSRNNLGIGVDAISKISAKRVLSIEGNDYCWGSLPDYSPNYLYEPEYNQLTEEIISFYTSFLEGKNHIYTEKALKDAKYIHENFNVDHIMNVANKVLENYKNKKVSKIYYLIHSQSFGDTLASTPTVRYLYKSHREKINVVTYRKDIFKNNPYVETSMSFDEFNKLNLSGIIKYESFTYTGKKDNNGIEKKFSHIDVRQLHSMDLGFQLLPEDMGYDFYPNPLSLDIELPKKYVVLHVTTNWANRTWDYNNWKNLIKWLKENQIFTVLIGSGYREELHNSYSDKPLDKECPMFDDYYGLDLTNKGTMSDMWWVINGAKCLITMDSGPLHLAGTTDVEIIQLGSAINPKFRAPYRHGTQDYKYHYLGGGCSLFCNSNLYYNVKEWGDINSVPPQPHCAENKPTFECHPQAIEVFEKMKDILNLESYSKFEDYLEILPFDEPNRINFNFKKTLDKSIRIEVIDVSTGLKRDKWEGKCDRLEPEYYWWCPVPGKLDSLGSIYLKLFIDDVYIDKILLEFSGGKKIIVNNEEYYFDNLDDYSYNTFWEIFVHDEYQIDGKNIVDKNDIVLDIGANLGFFALHAIENGAQKVYCVEPFPTVYRNIEKLSERLPIVPINKAVTSKTENVTMVLNTVGWAANCLSEYNNIFNNGGERITVEPININDLIESIGSDIDLIKIDCEGSELDLFETITPENLNKINKMVIEIHSEYTSNFIKEKLLKNNFEVKSKKGMFSDGSENILFVNKIKI